MQKVIFIILIFFLNTEVSYAYIGPGMGGGIIMATLGVIVAILAAIFGIVWFPVKRFLKSRKEKNKKKQID